jgi:hypothetical protein
MNESRWDERLKTRVQEDHIYWVTRHDKLEIPIDKDEVNESEIREYDG